MAAQVVGLNSTFNYQRQVVNELAVDVDVLKQSSLTTSTAGGVYTLSNVGIGTTQPSTKLAVQGDATISQVTNSIGGFISGISTTAVQITVSGSQLLFNVVGVGSTSLSLF
jgi:hypothetical protein